MFEDRLIEDGSLAADADGFSFGVRLNWYRSLPLSSVAQLDVEVDGTPIQPDAVTFITEDGGAHQLEALADHPDDWWFLTDTARIRVEHPGGLAPGEHQLAVTLGTRIPYVVMDPPDVLVVVDSCRKQVTV
jgi:hypothetical protein